MAKRKSTNRGRNLKRTETQAGIDISRYVSGERGRTNGRFKLSAVSASSPRLRRRFPKHYTRLMPKPLDAITLGEYMERG